MTTPLKQINVRIPPELHQALAEHKERTNEDKSDVVRRGIELALGVETSREPAPSPGDAPPAPPADSEPPVAAAGATAARHPADPEHREGSGSGDSTSDSSTSDEASTSIDLIEWLAERTPLPRALLRARIGNGRLSVAGRPWHDLEIPEVLLDQVELDDTLIAP